LVIQEHTPHDAYIPFGGVLWICHRLNL